MKRILPLSICILLLVSTIPYTHAAEQADVIFSNEYTSENGLVVIDTVTVFSQSRTNGKTAYSEKSIYDGQTLVAYIRLAATFHYDGSSVSVVSKSVTQSDTYDGWSYVQNSLTSSGGTVTLNAKLTKWIILNTSFTMTLSCDKDGNISYT